MKKSIIKTVVLAALMALPMSQKHKLSLVSQPSRTHRTLLKDGLP